MSDSTLGDTGPVLGSPAEGVAGALSDRYQILGEAARGGMGVVYRARQKNLDRPVAIKVMLPGASAERFLREARLLAKVQSPHVVAIHDYQVLGDGRPVVVMEWVEGSDLLNTLRARGGKLAEAEALPLMIQTARGMLAAASEGIVHRDLKPSNILVDAEGRARVGDFGLARGPAFDPDLSVTGEVLGTPFYMAPEQWENPRELDTRVDIYSFGASFYHALVGRPPFSGQSAIAILLAHKTEPLLQPRALNPEISERVGAILERCLAKRPSERFASFADLLRHLEALEPERSPWDDPEDDVRLAAHLVRYQSRRELYLLRLMSPNEIDVYEFPGARTLKLVRGDIVKQDVEALVSSDDGTLTMSAGVSKAIREAAGEKIVSEARRHAPVRAGRAIVTSGGRLRARHVIHGITLEFSRDRSALPSRDLVREILESCVYHADSLYVERIALPLLGAGTAGLPEEVVLDTTFRFFARLFACGLTGLKEVRVVLF